MSGINSTGVREWINWISPLSLQYEIILLNCPKTFVVQFSSVVGFLPDGVIIKSFYVPIYCDSCGTTDNILFILGKEVVELDKGFSLNFSLDSLKVCKSPSCRVELDVSEAKYFLFLKYMKRKVKSSSIRSD